MNLKNKKMKQKHTPSRIESGRILPQAVDCEEAVIGALLLEKDSLSRVSDVLTPEMFYSHTNKIIYQSIGILEKENRPVDMLTVIEQLRKDGALEQVGGVSYIAQLTQKVVSSAHIEYHSNIILQKFLARRIITDCSKIIKNAFDETKDIDDTLNEAETAIANLKDGITSSSEMQHISKLMSKSLHEMHDRIEAQEQGIQRGINTGLADLNKTTNGWQNGNLVVIAGRPAMGKTAMALHFTKSAARTGTHVAVFSLEMTGKSLADRMILSEANISPDKFKSGRMSQDEAIEVEKSLNSLYNLPIYIDDGSNMTMSKIRSKCRILKKNNQLGLIIIDYLQLAEGESKSGNREQEISAMSRAAKKMAKEFDVPLILLSQLSRAVEQREQKIPQLSDLRESGAIEQDADMVCFLYRPEYYGTTIKDKDGNPIKNYLELRIAKFREGNTGVIKAIHNGSLTKIFDYDANGYTNVKPSDKSNGCPY